MKKVFLNRLPSHQRGAYTEKDISPFHWVNTRPPDREQSPEWLALRANGFRDYRREVGGLVKEPKSFSIEELKAVASQDQITMHTCMQGWTGIAKWTGIPLSAVLAQVEPLPEAHYVMIESFGTAQQMSDGRPVEPYYEVLPIKDAMEPETMLAWGMNDEPLPDMYSWIRDYAEVGDGMGGTREDSGYQDINARI